MDQEKFNFKLKKLQQNYVDKSFINKKQMLHEINKSQTTSYRRELSNDKFDIPLATYSKEYQRKGKKYSTYDYDLYDLAVFLTDKEYYWEMMNERINNANN